ncbi:kinase-like domain-containing protein, partial [Fusarium redolens]
KELHLDDSNDYSAEASTLEKLSRLEHQHLIRCLATYQQGGKYCFLFEWAEGGNLRQFWANRDGLTRNIDLVGWAFLQMKGLVDGLNFLHNFSSRENCRHGDLKPENILRFLDADASGLGRLVMSDLGSATFHAEATRSRGRGTGAGYGTIRYEPPEARTEKMKPRSRRYDVWSMGCIFLEFLIWLMYSWDDLDWFNQEVDRYWLDDGSGARVHPGVTKCIEQMQSDPRCQGDTALADLLEAIKRRLLV